MAISYLPLFLSEFVETGGGSGLCIRRNIDAFDRHMFITKSIVDVSTVASDKEVLGRKYARPFGFSAVANLSLFCRNSRRNADLILAEIAHKENVPYILSNHSTNSIEEVTRVAPDNIWVQLYPVTEDRVTSSLIGRAHDAGVKVLVVTVDFPIQNRSETARRRGVSYATGADWKRWPSILADLARHPRWAVNYLLAGGMPRMGSFEQYAPNGSSGVALGAYLGRIWPKNLLWGDIERIRKQWPGKLVLKGLCHPDEVVRAREAGADAVTISNHGGNKLDCVPAAIDLLSMVRPIIGPSFPLFTDGGIRRGADILTALALGADFCFVGRPALYGLAAGGSTGARRVFDILSEELRYTQAMTGCLDCNSIERDAVMDSEQIRSKTKRG
ncbi:MAG: alpha-hydroxy acid oxidase [Alphaproteobacteria bacterium]